MSARERRTVPPVVCRPWCEDGTGHPDQLHPSDQRCHSSWVEVTMTLAPKFEGGDGNWYAQHVDVFGEASPVLPEAVVISVEATADDEPDVYLRLTALEARVVAAALTATADALEGAE